MSIDPPLDLPRFRASVAAHSARDLSLPTDTHRRYSAGRVPLTFVRLLLRRPDIAHALCRDIEEKTQGPGNADPSA